MYILIIMLVCLLLYIIRIIKGPTTWDRLLGMNLVATKIVIIIIAFASLYNLAYLLDFAIVYAIFGFIGTIFIALFLLDKMKGGKK